MATYLKMAFHPDEQIYQCIRGNYKIIADTTIHFYPTQDLINNFVTIENLDKDHSFREILLPTKVKNIEFSDNSNATLDTMTIKKERLLTKKWHFIDLAYASPQLYNAEIIDHFHSSFKRRGDAIEYTTDSSIIFPVLRLRIPNDVNKLKIVVNEQQYEIVIPKGNGLYFPRMYQYTNVSNFDMKWRIEDEFLAPYFGSSKLVTSVQLELLSFPVPQKWHKTYLFFRNNDEDYQPCNFYPK
ncbi:MAG: hypothetical protein MK212_02320 [Saprospiraceae bacterium]|nr:hypothetical protein [Saprospiraceae bacterium]